MGTWQDWVPPVSPHVPCVAGRNRNTRGRTAETHAARALPLDLVRISVGIEDPDDLIVDLSEALGKTSPAAQSADIP
jgi:hypothetical protein